MSTATFGTGRMALSCLLAFMVLLSGIGSGRAETQDAPAAVKIGYMLASLSRIDTAGGSFDFKAYVWMIDPTGRIDPVSNLEVLARHATITEIATESLPDGTRYSAVEIEGTVDHEFDIRDFPFDEQTLRIGLETEFPTNLYRLEADADDSLVADFAVVAGWEVRGLEFDQQIIDYPTRFGFPGRASDGANSRFSRLTMLVDIQRSRTALVIEKFIGYTVALLIAGLIYFVPPDQIGVRIGMVTSAIFAAVGNRYSLDSVLGAETTFGLVDSLSLIVFGTIYVALVTSLVVHRLHLRRTAAAAARVDRWAGLVAVPLSFGLAILALVLAHH